MFDILLQFVQRNCQSLLKIYNTEREKMLEGTMVIIEEKRSADVRYFKDDLLPYEEKLKEELAEKKKFFEATEVDEVKLTDKWIVDLPPIKKEYLEKTPVWYLILDDSHHQTLFVGIPQEVDEETVQYILVAETHQIMIARHSWKREVTTEGLKYLRACYEASKNPLNYMIFRSNSDFCKVINREIGYGEVIRRLEKSQLASSLKRMESIEKIGSPIIKISLESRYKFSRETLRHLQTLMVMKERFGRMKDWTIREFGGGYGSLCALFSIVSRWKSYQLLEISHCANLAKIVLADMGVKDVQVQDIDEIKEVKEVDLFISEFAFDELNDDGLERYKELVTRSKNAIFVMDDDDLLVDRFSRYLNELFQIELVRLEGSIIVFVCRDKGNIDDR